jgi:hypothetical protein
VLPGYGKKKPQSDKQTGAFEVDAWQRRRSSIAVFAEGERNGAAEPIGA